MNNQLLERINFDFDIKNHRELSPYVYFSDIAFYSAFQNKLDHFNVKDYHHSSVLFGEIEAVEQRINYIKNDKSDKEKLDDVLQPFIRNLQFIVDLSHSSSSIENLFSIPKEVIYDVVYESQYFATKLKKIIKRNLMQMPISTALFPHYRQLTTNYFFYDDHTLDENSNNNNAITNEQKLTEIIENSIGDKKESQKLISIDDLIQFLNILSAQTKIFSFSPTFILATIEKFNNFLNTLFSLPNSNQQNNDSFDNNYLILNEIRKLPPGEEKQTKINYFRLINLIKMRFYMIIQKIHEALSILILFIIMEQENLCGLDEEKQFSFKNLFQETLPISKKRAKIIQNISNEQIIDFYCSSDEKNDFILTKDGLFKINQSNELTKIDVDPKIFENLSTNEAKITFSDEILYILSLKDKTIHKIFIQKDENDSKKEENNNQNHPHTTKEVKNPNKRKNKKLREKVKKEKKEQRKRERKENEKPEINLDSVKIDLPNYPLVSIGAYNNYVRILQRKSYNDKETTFIFTNIDLTPNSRMDFDIIEAFKEANNEIKFKQTQSEIIVQDKNKQYKLCDACFNKDFLSFSFEDSTFEQWMIFNDGKVNLCRHLLSPYLLSSKSRLKIDNNLFLHILEPVQENSVCFAKMYLPDTKYYIKTESELFIKYPYLQNFSDIVDNCTHFIINKEVKNIVTTDEYYEVNDMKRKRDQDENKSKKVQIKESCSFSVSPEEMSTIVQSPTAITLKMEELKDLIKEIKDDELKQFFISLFIKISGINILYCTRAYYSSKNKINDSAKERFEKFRTFALDLFSIGKSFYSINCEIMMKESILFTFSLAAKFLFFPNRYESLHNFMNDFANSDEQSKILLRNLSYYVFSLPHSLYIVDDSIFNAIIKFEDDINIQELFMKSIYYILFENKFSKKSMEDEEFMVNISPYIQSAFKYIHHLVTNDSEPLIKIEQILSYFMTVEDGNNPFLSFSILKEFNKIATPLYNRIKKQEGVIESDKMYQEQNQDLYKQIVHKEIKIIESEHPYNNNKNSSNLNILKEDDDHIIEDLGTIDFGPEFDAIYVMFDNKCDINDDDKIIIYCNNDESTFTKRKDFLFNQAIKFEGSRLQIKFSRNKNTENNESNWGYKITLIGISYKNQFYWISNQHLFFYNCFIMFYCTLFADAFDSTASTKSEKEFDLILNEKMIQGIKFEEIDNYENNLIDDRQPKKKLKRTLTRGISRGISFDTDNDSAFSDEFKKSFIKDFINAKEDQATRGKKLLDILYLKTAKKNRIRLNDATKSILENERYLAACLFKQLGLINVCLKFIDNFITKKVDNPDEIELPTVLQSVWKKIYSLRQTLFFSYQKSKAIPNQNSQENKEKNSIKLDFKKYSEEIKRKCILLLYSDPILKFKEKGNLDNDTIESTSSSIFSFVTSEISLSNISDLIDIQRKRLSFKMKSLSLLSDFLDQDSLFESSKIIFAQKIANFSSERCKIKGLTKKEFDEFHKLFDQVTLKFIEKNYSNPSIVFISKPDFLYQFLFCINDDKDDFQDQISKSLINVLEKNKCKHTFIHELTNIMMILAMLTYALKNKNNQLVDYIFSLLFSDEIDLVSKKLILAFTPLIIYFMPDYQKATDKQLAYSFIESNKNSPIIVRSIFYWIASIFNSSNKNKNDEDDIFVNKVLKGIGQSFVGEKCSSFIDDSFSSFTSRQIAEGMISFIRLLVNMKNEIYLKSVHDVLLNKINQIKFNDEDNNDDILASIGLFSSIGQELSAFEPERCIISDSGIYISVESIIGLNESIKKIRKADSYQNKLKGVFTNMIIMDPKLFDLNEKEIENILQLHEVIFNSKYFKENQDYNINISQKEINENVLISSFYSFLAVVMQNQNNANILMNEKNISKTLSLFKFAMNLIPTNENSFVLLSHYQEKAIHNSMYSSNSNKNENIIDKDGSFRFMKMNYGEIIYNNDNFDIIKSRKDHYNLFIATRPFNSDKETYFEVKINQIGNKQIFIGFIDSEEKRLNKAFGFGCQGQSQIFCRRSANLSKSIEVANDKIMKDDKNEIIIKNGDIIGCYYTYNYVYLTINGTLTKYRLSHNSVNSYIPLISIDHDEIELEITKNVSFVDVKNKLNIQSDDFFKEKDFIKINTKAKPYMNSDYLIEDQFYIGQNVFVDRSIFHEKDTKMESIEIVSNDQLRERENYGIIRDIKPIEQNPFVSKITIETYNHLTLSKEIVNDIDSRYITFKKTNFFNLFENRMNTKIGMNNEFNLKSLPNELRVSFDLNLISKYLRNKTIFENSKSIAIIMSRYLIFILLDYLRFIKSPLLKDEGIESEEMNCILNSLSVSIPTITCFKPRFVCELDKDRINDFLVFKEENTDEVIKRRRSLKIPLLLPGFKKVFDRSFKVFLKKSEQFISTKFITKLLQISIEKAISKEILSCDYLYSLISPKYKIESNSPLPNEFEVEKEIKRRRLRKNEKIVGYIPILLNSVPIELPEIECCNKKYRESSNKITSFNYLINSIDMKWSCNLDELKEISNLDSLKNFKLQFGLLLLSSSNLPEDLSNSSLSFIQILLNMFQVFTDSDTLFEKYKEFLRGYLLEKIFSLSLKKCPITYPFLQIITVMLISKFGFSDSLFSKNAENASFIFDSLSKKLHQMKDFPTGKNELPLLFSIYSNLIQIRIKELKNDNVSDLFDKYYEINENLFKIENDEKTNDVNKSFNDSFENNEKKKNFRLLYLLYHYSSLLHNDKKLPYPMFLFVHDWLRQKFGSFRKTISKKEINYFNAIKIDENKEIVYQSEILNNENDLNCSYQLFNIYEKQENNENDDKNSNKKSKNSKKVKEKDKEKDKDKEKEKEVKKEIEIKPANKVFVHQLNDDKKIELPQSGESVTVSFPLEIIIIHEKDEENKTKELEIGDVFIFNFNPSEKIQKECFINNYDQIQNDIQQFISLEKYDNEIMEKLNFDGKIDVNDNKDNNENSNENDNVNNNENNNESNSNESNNDDENNDNNNSDDDENHDNDNNSSKKEESKNDYVIYELQKIPINSAFQIEKLPESINSNVISLRCSIISTYRFLIENIMMTYTIDKDDDDDDDDDENGYSYWWRKSLYSDDKAPNRYMQQIIRPAYSMSTESKFLFINKILKSETKESYELQLIFNRFEQQKFFENKEQKSTSLRPLFIQLMEQIDENSIHLLKVRGGPPFRVNLVGEGAVDGGGPGREIFSSLIVEMMNDKLGIFTSNPNRLRHYKETNREDLIPNKKLMSENYSDEMDQLLTKRFLYAGALIAVCIVSTLPQPMKLANFIWEYLTNENVSIESIYEIDEDFKQLMFKAESLENRILNSDSQMTDDEFKTNFLHVFNIRDSYNKVVDLIPSGSNIPVTKENLHEFIRLAKNERIHEFDNELKELKDGFDKIMIYKNIASILRPNELKLLVCGEMNCKVEHMKKIMEIKTPYLRNEKITEDDLVNMFWNVMESFSVDERTLFIRFSSGNLGLPAPGLKWEENIKIYISSREEKEKEGKTLVTSSTCSSEANIPFYESEEELAKMIRISLKFFGIINDGNDELNEVSHDLF